MKIWNPIEKHYFTSDFDWKNKQSWIHIVDENNLIFCNELIHSHFTVLQFKKRAQTD